MHCKTSQLNGCNGNFMAVFASDACCLRGAGLVSRGVRPQSPSKQVASAAKLLETGRTSMCRCAMKPNTEEQCP